MGVPGFPLATWDVWGIAGGIVGSSLKHPSSPTSKGDLPDENVVLGGSCPLQNIVLEIV